MANRLQQARDFNPYAAGVTVEELQQVRRQLSKVMNQRMKRLEDATSPITGEKYTYGAYDIMQDYLKKEGRTGKAEGLRFSETLSAGGKSKAQLQKEIRILQGFEDMPSSRVAGQRAIEKKRIETFINPDPKKTKRKGLHESIVSDKDFYDFLNSSTFEELSRSISSDIIVEEYDKAADRGVSREKIEEALEEYMQKADQLSITGIRRKLRSRKLT